MKMMEYTNSATRILNLFELLQQKAAPNEPMYVAWSRVFDLDISRTASDPQELNHHLTTLRQEIGLFKSQVIASGYPESLYMRYVNDLISVSSLLVLTNPWQSYLGTVNGELLLSLRFFGHLLTKEEALEISELEAILNAISNLRQEIESSGLSQLHRDFFLQQLDIMELGIKDYPIRGRESLKKSFFDCMNKVQGDETGAAESSDYPTGMTSIMKKVSEVGKFVETANKALQSAKQLYGSVAPAIECTVELAKEAMR